MNRTKNQKKEKARFDAVLQRVEDIYAGANIYAVMREDGNDTEYRFSDFEAIGRVVRAVSNRFSIPTDHWLFEPWHLLRFETPSILAKTIVENDLDRMPAKEEV